MNKITLIFQFFDFETNRNCSETRSVKNEIVFLNLSLIFVIFGIYFYKF